MFGADIRKIILSEINIQFLNILVMEKDESDGYFHYQFKSIDN
jgi:hypothetical protein